MYDLFDSHYEYRRNRVVAPYFDRAKAALQRDLVRIADYYHTAVTHVKNEHPLVRLLNGLTVSMKRDWEDYVYAIKQDGYHQAGMVRLTTPLNRGAVCSPGYFYGGRSTEIVFVHDEDFDLKATINDWRNARPIRVLRHPFSDVSMARCDGRYVPSSKPGIAVIAINLPMLAVQYRCWVEKELVLFQDVGRGTRHFVSMYPITNMIYSHLDVAIFNRLSAMMIGDDLDRYVRSHPIYTSDNSELVDQSLRRAVGELGRSSMAFDQLIDNIPLASGESLRDIAVLPNVIETRQVEWALITAAIPMVRFLLRFNATTASDRNRLYINRLVVWLREIRNDRDLENIMPITVFRDVDDMIHRDLASYIYGRG